MLTLSKQNQYSTEESIIQVLQTIKEGTTAEIISQMTNLSPECTDTVLTALVSLAKLGITKNIVSKDRKGFVWIFTYFKTNYF